MKTSDFSSRRFAVTQNAPCFVVRCQRRVTGRLMRRREFIWFFGSAVADLAASGARAAARGAATHRRAHGIC